jgi:hypothetical protein
MYLCNYIYIYTSISVSMSITIFACACMYTCTCKHVYIHASSPHSWQTYPLHTQSHTPSPHSAHPLATHVPFSPTRTLFASSAPSSPPTMTRPTPRPTLHLELDMPPSFVSWGELGGGGGGYMRFEDGATSSPTCALIVGSFLFADRSGSTHRGRRVAGMCGTLKMILWAAWAKPFAMSRIQSLT